MRFLPSLLLPLGLAALAAGCGTTPYSAPAAGVGCSVVVKIPTSGTTVLGTVRAKVGGHEYTLRRDLNTILAACGDRVTLSATATDPKAHPFTQWVLSNKITQAQTLSFTVNGLVSAQPEFLVPLKPKPSPSPHAKPSPSPSPTASPSASPSTVTLDQFVSYDAATKTLTWKALAGYKGVNLGLDFDGEANGAMKVSVPVGWTVVVNFSNVGAINHSAAVVSGGTTTTPAFPGASTPSPTTGTAPGQTATFTFLAATPGRYRLACLLPGHEDRGMWETFTVTSGGLPTASL